MRTWTSLLWLGMCAALTGCGGSGDTPASSTSPPPSDSATVNLVVSDTPATNLTVLSFEVQITGAVLQPGDVSLLSHPVTVDLAQLVTDSSFLASTVVGSATYTSLTVTLANPEVTLMNSSAVPIALPGGQVCEAGAVCTFQPALNSASVTIASSIFPVTVTAGSTTGLALDLSIPDLLQSDLSITLADGSSVNLSLLNGNGSRDTQATLEDVLGTVTAVSGDQVSVTTALGNALVLTAGSATVYHYPASVCPQPAASCLAVGQVVSASLSLPGEGALAITSLSYLAGAGTPLVKALVLGVDTSGASPLAQVLLQGEVNVPSLGIGSTASVSLTADTAYLVGVPAYPQPAGAGFASPGDLLPGQVLIMSVGADLASGGTPTFSTGTVYLEPSQAVGRVASIDTGAATLELNQLARPFSLSPTLIDQLAVQTDASTAFVGLAPASLSAISAGQFVAVKGRLLHDGTAEGRVLGALQIRARTQGN